MTRDEIETERHKIYLAAREAANAMMELFVELRESEERVAFLEKQVVNLEVRYEDAITELSRRGDPI
jgi:hypothetical protein